VRNFGCGTVIQTSKRTQCQADTNEFGSQVLKDVKEQCCDGSIQTESKGTR